MLVPSKPALWDKTQNLFAFQQQEKLVEYYENLGGRWKIAAKPLVESVKKPTAKKAVAKKPVVKESAVPVEEADLGPLTGHHNSISCKRWVRRLKATDPAAYERLINWD